MRVIAASICVILLTACTQNPTITSIEEHSTAPSEESLIYRAFIRKHGEEDWKRSCSHVVVDTAPLPVSTKDPTYLFHLEPETPPIELLHRLTSLKEHVSISVPGEPFFIPVDHRVMNAMFRQSCSVEEMRQLKCGWLQFKQLYGSACGIWRFSPIVFTAQRNAAIFRYDLSVYRWTEGGYAYMRLTQGKWKLISIGVEFVS